MWSPFVFQNTNFLLKMKREQNIYIYLTDLKNIWCETFENEGILEHFKKENPSVTDLNLEACIEQVILLIDYIGAEGTTLKMKHENDSVSLAVRSNISDFIVKFEFQFNMQDSNTFLTEFTIPLMQTVGYLESEQKRLCKLLVKKDLEIQEHIFENGDINRKHIKTEPFDGSNTLSIQQNKQLLLNLFDKCSKFQDVFTEKFGSVENVIVKTEPTNNSRKKIKVHKPSKSFNKKLGVVYNNQ